MEDDRPATYRTKLRNVPRPIRPRRPPMPQPCSARPLRARRLGVGPSGYNVFRYCSPRAVVYYCLVMTYVRSTFRHPALPKNDLGYTVDYYEGSLSTLCAGCGHDSINAAIVQACWEMNIEPHKVAKLSGIG